MPISVSDENLVEYKNSNISDDDEIDDECCWGVAYEIDDVVWTGEAAQEWVQYKLQGGYKEMKLAFYPQVSNIICASSVFVSKTSLTISGKLMFLKTQSKPSMYI